MSTMTVDPTLKRYYSKASFMYDCTIMILNDKVRQALTAGNLAHLVTLNKDGSPQVSIVWVGLDGDEIVCAHLNLYKKLKNIQRDIS